MQQLRAINDSAVRHILRILCRNLDEFVEYPQKALLLWKGCKRTHLRGERGKPFVYPAELKQRAKRLVIPLDTRRNGPAILAFKVAGGHRPERRGSTHAWHIHHLYSGKFPYCERTETLHAASSGLHFTQSAGLVAIHPIADAASDEYPWFAWLLRAQAFCRFAYDPDDVFNGKITPYGFASGKRCRVAWAETTA